MLGGNPIFLGEFKCFVFVFFLVCLCFLVWFFTWLLAFGFCGWWWLWRYFRSLILGLIWKWFSHAIMLCCSFLHFYLSYCFLHWDNVRFKCGRRQNEIFEENLNLKSMGDFDFGKSLSVLIMHVLFLLYEFGLCDTCLLKTISHFG